MGVTFYAKNKAHVFMVDIINLLTCGQYSDPFLLLSLRERIYNCVLFLSLTQATTLLFSFFLSFM
jgi:hypothetical protein